MQAGIRKNRHSDGGVLPHELMQRLNFKQGRSKHVVELPDGGFQAIPYDPEFEKTMAIAHQIMDVYKDFLAALARA